MLQYFHMNHSQFKLQLRKCYKVHRRKVILCGKIYHPNTCRDSLLQIYITVSPDIQILLKHSVTGIWTLPWSMVCMIQKNRWVKREKDPSLFFKQEHLTYFWALTYFKYYFFLFPLPDDPNDKTRIQGKKRTRADKRTFAMLLSYGSSHIYWSQCLPWCNDQISNYTKTC